MADSNTGSATCIAAGGALVGPALELRQEVAVRVEGGRIAEVGSAGDVLTRWDGDVDYHPHLLLAPGFIDAHVHIGFFAPRDLLVGGITTARDLGWPPGEVFELARRSLEETFVGPTVVAAGPMLTVAGGYPTRAAWAPEGTGRVVDGPDAARAAVTDVADAGAAVVKVALNAEVGPTMGLETLRAVVAEAKAHGLRVTGHVYGVHELEKAVEAGMQELAHMLMSEELIPDALLQRMVDLDMTIVPTLSIRSGRDLETAVENLARFRALGGRIVYGTDLGNEGPRPGIEEREIDALSAAGMSPHAIVTSATVQSALWLGLNDRGVIAPGMRADLITLPAQALGEAAALAQPQTVWRAGRRVI